MRIVEAFRAAHGAFRATLENHHSDQVKVNGISGDVFMTLRDGKSGEVQDERHQKNLIVTDASILLARLIKNNAEPPFGAFVLATGTGDVGWPPLSPPAATVTQRSLYAELARKTFASTTFIDGGGLPTSTPSRVIDLTTQFSESESVGPLMEMGLVGGNISTNLAIVNPTLPPNGPYNPLVDLTASETLVNYITFPMLGKPATSTLTVTWRLSF
jgi:hypothetical protein